MKNYSLFMGCLLLACFAYGQVNLSPDGAFAECPDQWMIYTAINSFGGGCIYDWEVTNGEIQGGIQSSGKWTFSGGNLISVKWKNSTSSGTIKATARNCIDVNGNRERSETIAILTLQGVTPGTIFGPQSVPANNTSNRVYEVPQVNHPNRGTSDPNPLQVNGYEWEIPTGWTIVSGGNTKRVTLKPDAFTQGSIRVRGKLQGCDNSPYYSNWSQPFPVSRTIATPTAIAGNDGLDYVVCGDTDPITFSVSAVAGATSYTWTKPSGWSGSSTINSITLTPNGTSAGDITVKANSGPYTSSPQTRSLTVEPTDPNNPPATTGPSLLCNNAQATYTVSNVPAGTTVTWSKSSNLSIVSGQGTTSLRVKGASSGSGNAWVRPTLSNDCGNVLMDQKDFWLGSPEPAHNSTVYVTGYYGQDPITLVANGAYDFQISKTAGATQYSWQPPSGFSFVGTAPSISSASLWTPGQNGRYILKVYPSNSCGSAGTGYASLTIDIVGGTGGGPGDPNCPDPPCDIPISARITSGDDPTVIPPTNLDARAMDYHPKTGLVLRGFLPNTQVTILDASGTYITEYCYENAPIHFNGLTRGIYIAIAVDERKALKKRILIQ